MTGKSRHQKDRAFSAPCENALKASGSQKKDADGLQPVDRRHRPRPWKQRSGSPGADIRPGRRPAEQPDLCGGGGAGQARSEEHTSELQSLMRISYAVFCLKNKK